MQVINYKLDVFEGPMDLLLHLISKHKLNIHDIEIFTLVEQYSEYVRQMKESDMEVASDFIEMAARLVYIKTVSLLPVHDEAEKLKEELSGELIEYAKCKEIATELSKTTQGFDYFERQPMAIPKDNEYKRIHNPSDILEHYMAVLQKGKKLPPPIESFGEIISRKIVSVNTKIIGIYRKLVKKSRLKMKELYEGSTSVSELVATFLAVLEMVRASKIEVDDNEDPEVQLIRKKK